MSNLRPLLSNLGPLLIVFGFFASLFVIGKILQNHEREKRAAKRAKSTHMSVIEPFASQPQPQQRGFESALTGGKGQGRAYDA